VADTVDGRAGLVPHIEIQQVRKVVRHHPTELVVIRRALFGHSRDPVRSRFDGIDEPLFQRVAALLVVPAAASHIVLGRQPMKLHESDRRGWLP
jgi:hypothetical protein